MKRVITYIDGFNLYFGMKELGNDTLWLNIHKLSINILKPSQELIEVKYFTSRISNNPNKQRRQNIYLEALETLSSVSIFYGKYQAHTETCRHCGHSYPYSNEKMSDVNIAVNMLADAFEDKFDTAILITGDSDLVPPINAINRLFPDKKIIVAFPPKRQNSSVKNCANGSFVLGRKTLKDSQLSDQIKKSDGFMLIKPTEWV